MSSTDAVIEADELTKRFGDVVAVDEVTFSIGPGQVLGLLGPNGAGKTTLVKMLTTLIGIDTGAARSPGSTCPETPMRSAR